MVEFTDANWDAEVLQHKGVALVDFWAPWCGPCRSLTPAIEDLAVRYAGKAKVGKLNVDEHQNVAATFSVMTIPVIMVFKDGQPVEQIIGAKPPRVIEDALKAHL
jgi:thioredoxin 1